MNRNSPMKRTPFPQLTFAEALAKLQAKRRTEQSKPASGRTRLKAGPRMKEWRRVWTWLKPRLEAAGRTFCEFDFIIHECEGPLDPAHSKKRREMDGDDIYAVAIACRKIHRVLDEKYDHEQMEVAVMYAINRHGGIIVPASKEVKVAA